VNGGAVRDVLQGIESRSPGAAVYVGSGGHGSTFGNYFGRDLSFVDAEFLEEDVASSLAVGNSGVRGPRVLDLSHPGDLQIFKSAEALAKEPGQDHIFTIRAWCFSSRSCL
jgi:hypothetical protein